MRIEAQTGELLLVFGEELDAREGWLLRDD
jgi:hypothetical protein